MVLLSISYFVKLIYTFFIFIMSRHKGAFSGLLKYLLYFIFSFFLFKFFFLFWVNLNDRINTNYSII